MKKFFIAFLAVLAAAVAAVFIYRYQLFQYSAEAAIRALLPDYIAVDKMTFDLKKSQIVLKGFRIRNAPGFSENYLLEIDEISCGYRMRGRNLLDGLELLDPSFKKPALSIERLADGRLNLNEMNRVLARPQKETARSAGGSDAGEGSRLPPQLKNAIGEKKISDMVKLPRTFLIKDGRIEFLDRFTGRKPHLITFENIDATMSLTLDASYARLLRLDTSGEGRLNGNIDERLKWDMSWNPATERLTMSSRFEAEKLDIVAFEPYYDRYSPFVFKRGRFSGLFIFDFDNGNIGSTNEVHLSQYLFYIKRGYENSAFWESNVQDLARYFTTPSGKIVFDFKIKGDMSNPRFFLGPIAKKALGMMAIDKISGMMQGVSGGQSGGSQGGSGADNINDYIQLFRGLVQKK